MESRPIISPKKQTNKKQTVQPGDACEDSSLKLGLGIANL
jgi:hypothetical protein